MLLGLGGFERGERCGAEASLGFDGLIGVDGCFAEQAFGGGDARGHRSEEDMRAQWRTARSMIGWSALLHKSNPVRKSSVQATEKVKGVG